MKINDSRSLDSCIHKNGKMGCCWGPSIVDLVLVMTVGTVTRGTLNCINSDLYKDYLGITAACEAVEKNEKLILCTNTNTAMALVAQCKIDGGRRNADNWTRAQQSSDRLTSCGGVQCVTTTRRSKRDDSFIIFVIVD